MFKNVRKEEITIPAQMSYLIQVREFIEHIGKKYKYTEKIINSFKLVIDEACTNIIRHGYRDIKNGEIVIKAIVRRLSLTIVIVDQGRSYDPRQANTPDLAKYVDIGKKGGLGILMMRKLMDDLQYNVSERGNEFRLTKFREETHETPLMQFWHNLTLKTKYSFVVVTSLTLIALLTFVFLFVGIDRNVREDVFSISSSAAKTLAENSINDYLNENYLGLFEKSRSIQQNNRKYLEEAFFVDSLENILARSLPLSSARLGKYEIPAQYVLVDTAQGLNIYQYRLADSMTVYDFRQEIRRSIVGEGEVLGFVYIRSNEQLIQQLTYSRKLWLIFYVLLLLGLSYAGAFMLISRILSPFHNLAGWVREVIHDKVDQDEIDIDASDELGEIAQAFNDMTIKFREAQVNLIEQQKLQKELQVAQEIQQMLLPQDFPEVEGYELASYYEAAKEVGGDLFDFLEVDEDTIGICIADVSGKGVPGSMIMTMIRTALRLEARGNKNPAEVLTKVNRFVTDDMKRGMFVTMFYLVLDSRQREISYASAGHNPMILYRGRTQQTYYLNPSGFPVGIQLPDIELFGRKIQTDSIRLQEDDILVLYTDGITEAMNVKRELFREERFLTSIRVNSHLDVGEFIKSIKGDLKDFTGGAPQNDDITFVAIKEKLMQGEIVYNIQKELTELIASGMTIKEACERLRISPYQYYKYKDIIERKGLKGFKKYLEDQDHIERRHLSIEMKTKIFDVIRKNPEFGAARIASELRNPEYGNEKIDAQRIYNELVKMRLNTQTLRERYIQKGGKARIKQPGTPLLTLDGQVILDFKSSEETINRQRGKTTPSFSDRPRPADDSKTLIREFGTQPRADKSQMMHKPAYTPPTSREIEPETAPLEVQEKSEILPEVNGIRIQTYHLAPKAALAVTATQVEEFFSSVADDLKSATALLNELDDMAPSKAVKRAIFIIKIISNHPGCRSAREISELFRLLSDTLASLDKHQQEMSSKLVRSYLNDLLKYVEKDNKFDSYNNFMQTINEIGLIKHKIESAHQARPTQLDQQMADIRETIARKKIVRI